MSNSRLIRSLAGYAVVDFGRFCTGFLVVIRTTLQYLDNRQVYVCQLTGDDTHTDYKQGLAIGMQIMAYGASKPVPFQRGICESQALEGGITGNFTRVGMDLVWQARKSAYLSL